MNSRSEGSRVPVFQPDVLMNRDPMVSRQVPARIRRPDAPRSMP